MLSMVKHAKIHSFSLPKLMKSWLKRLENDSGHDPDQSLQSSQQKRWRIIDQGPQK